MQEEDIPLLTAVHTISGQPPRQLSIGADLIAEILSQIQPLLVDEIEKAVTQRLGKITQNDIEREISGLKKDNQAFFADRLMRHSEQVDQKLDEIYQQVAVTTKQTVMEANAVFSDKIRADFATEIPKMMHANADIIQADLAHTLSKMQTQGLAEVQAKLTDALPMLQQSLIAQLQTTLNALEVKSVENATHTLQDKISKLHEDLLIEHQVRLAREFTTVYQGLTEQSHAELNIYLEALQLKSKQQLVTELDKAFPSLYQGMSEELSATLKQKLVNMAEDTKVDFMQRLDAELPAVEQALENKLQAILNAEVPRIEQKIGANIKAEIEQLLDSVRLIRTVDKN